MLFKEVMEPYTEENKIQINASIKEALIKLQDAKLDILIVIDEEDCLIGKLTSKDLLNAYQMNIPPDKAIKQIIKRSYEIVNQDDKLDKDIFSKTSLLIVNDDSGAMIGFLTEQVLVQKMFQQSLEKIKKEIQTKKILHQNEDIEFSYEVDRAEEYLDLYNRIDKLIHINKELWDIIEYSSDSIYVTDGKGVTVYANDAFEKMTGASVSAVLGRTVFEIEAENIYKPSISAIVLREKRQITLIQRGMNGKDLIVTGTPVFDINGNIYMVICNSKDIDELSILKNYLLNVKTTSIKTFDDSNIVSKIIYSSEYMRNLMKLVNKVTQVDSTVLITGESGTGKGLIAKYIHENSSRSNEKLIEINCSAIPESLFESELFGYESGAFTGASKDGKPGIIEMSNKGTLFLDEIGDMPMYMQVKLLKVLQDRKVTRVGAVKSIDIDIRIIAATNRDLKQLVEKELFRADLYYRLNVFPIHIAPLRERKEDIYTLLQHYLLHYNRKHSNDIVLTKQAQDKIANYSWPGNVRELEHFIERLAIIKEGIVDVEDLEMEYEINIEKDVVKVNKIIPLKEAISETERQLINLAMKITQNSYEIADLLVISQTSAHRKIKKYT